MAFSLRDQEVHHRRLEETPEHQDDVCFPANARERDGPGKLIQQACSVDDEAGECETFGSRFEVENFNRVEHLHGGETEREDYLEHVDQR